MVNVFKIDNVIYHLHRLQLDYIFFLLNTGLLFRSSFDYPYTCMLTGAHHACIDPQRWSINYLLLYHGVVSNAWVD